MPYKKVWFRDTRRPLEEKMLWSVKDLFGYTAQALDGETGKVHDVYFDNKSWIIRYFVIDIGDWVLDTGDWIPGRKVIVSPLAFRQPDRERRMIAITLIKEHIEHSPEADLMRLISYEVKAKQPGPAESPLHRPGSGLFEAGKTGMGPDALVETIKAQNCTPNSALATRGESAYHLSSARELLGNHIQACDGEIGHVEDFLIEPETWIIHFMVIDTRNWLPGKKVIIAPTWIEQVVPAESRIYVSLRRETIKNGPQLDPAALLNHESAGSMFS